MIEIKAVSNGNGVSVDSHVDGTGTEILAEVSGIINALYEQFSSLADKKDIPSDIPKDIFKSLFLQQLLNCAEGWLNAEEDGENFA